LKRLIFFNFLPQNPPKNQKIEVNLTLDEISTQQTPNTSENPKLFKKSKKLS